MIYLQATIGFIALYMWVWLIPIGFQTYTINSIDKCLMLDSLNISYVYSCQESYLRYPAYVSGFYLGTQIGFSSLISIIFFLSLRGNCCYKKIWTYEKQCLNFWQGKIFSRNNIPEIVDETKTPPNSLTGTPVIS